jgi:hypothetical protein
MILDDPALEDVPLSERRGAAYDVIAEYRRRIAAHEGLFADPTEREKGIRTMDELEAQRRRTDGLLN